MRALSALRALPHTIANRLLAIPSAAAVVARFSFAAGMFALCVNPDPAAAQGVPPATIEVSPATAGPGVVRQISVSMPWLFGCLPTASVVGSDIARKRTLTILLDDNQRDVFSCGDQFVAHRVTVSYRPESEGDLRVLVVSNRNAFFGEAVIHTRATDSNRSLYDLTGMWYDPATNGSGLTFMHGFGRNDTVFGTWYVYDRQGAPRWYTIQNVQWLVGGTFAGGTLYVTRADSTVCVPPFTGCPVALTYAAGLALVRIEMQGPNNARITATTLDASVITSNIIRSVF